MWCEIRRHTCITVSKASGARPQKEYCPQNQSFALRASDLPAKAYLGRQRTAVTAESTTVWEVLTHVARDLQLSDHAPVAIELA